MNAQTEFCFHGNLNDFLRPRERNKPVCYSYNWTPSVKDAIESIGIPHVEVGLIRIDQQQSNFSYLLKGNEHIDVFPFNLNGLLSDTPVVYCHFPSAFILDVHLGKLARILRLLGIDVMYDQHYIDPEIIQLALKENRTVLTRDIGLLKYKVLKHGYWLRSQDPEQQAVEVIRYFDLGKQLHPFTKCISCNGSIVSIPKEHIITQIPEDTALYYNSFFQCNCCHKIYWEGSHFHQMRHTISRIIKAVSE